MQCTPLCSSQCPFLVTVFNQKLKGHNTIKGQKETIHMICNLFFSAILVHNIFQKIKMCIFEGITCACSLAFFVATVLLIAAIEELADVHSMSTFAGLLLVIRS
jgi:hypothetical protein